MRLRYAVCLWLFCCFSVAAEDVVVLPTEELQIICDNGCNNIKQGYDWARVYVSAGSEVWISGKNPGGSGKWYNTAGGLVNEKEQIRFFAFTNAEFVFASSGQKKTVYVIVAKAKLCQPKFESEIYILGDDKKREWFAPGNIFRARIDIGSADCDYDIVWTTDSPEALKINNPNSRETEIEVIGLPGGKTPRLCATLYNRAGKIREKETNIKIERAIPPELALTVNVKNGKYSNSIIASCRSSSTPNENAKIKKFYAELYYFDGSKFINLGRQESGGGNITFDAKSGEGFYKVIAWVEDTSGAVSENKSSNVKVGPAEKEIPNVYVKSRYLYCFAGGVCEIDASETSRHNSNAIVEFYDEKGNKFGGSGDIRRITFSKPGIYKIYVCPHLFGEEGCFKKGSENEVTVVVL